MADDWQTVKVVNTEEEAALVVGFLNSNGIEAGAESLFASEFPTEVGDLAEVRIQVPAERATEALSLLAESERAVAEGSDFTPPNEE